MQKIRTKDGRARNFATIVYEESKPEDWIDIITELHVPIIISPLHDKDKWTKADEKKNPEHRAGETKKAHYHVLIMFEGKKSINQVETIIDDIGGVGCIIVESARGMARYLTHMDNPEKEQYKMEDVQTFGGANYIEICESKEETKRRRLEVIREMQEYCRNNKITEIADLLEISAECNDEWFDHLCNDSIYVMVKYLQSLERKISKK